MRAFLFMITSLGLLISLKAVSQEETSFTPSGKVSGVIYSNFHQGITPASKNDAAFEITRVYLGYDYAMTRELSARITLDIGSPDDISPFSKLRRYAYFKFAYVAYQQDKLELQFGLIGTLHYKLQEQLWERRYMRKAFADEFKLGPSADLGCMASYSFHPWLKADLSIMNGEGYTRLQMDDHFKYGAGITLGSPGQWVGRFYADYMKSQVAQVTFEALTSYTYRKNLNLSLEYNYQKNNSLTHGHDLFGWSAFGKYNLTPRYQLFARFDKLQSNILAGQVNPWHLAEDGSSLVAGVQFTPVKPLKLALSYQDWVPWAANLDTRAFIYFNLEIRM